MWGVWYSYNDIIMIIVVEILNMFSWLFEKCVFSY